MPLPSELSKPEVDFVMERLGYARSLLPQQDVGIYVNGSRRLAIDFNNGWDVPREDVLRQLHTVDIPTERIEEAYRQLYPV